MTKISDVHPTVAHSLSTTIKILEAAIELRMKEVDNMRACIIACQKVMADEMLPASTHDAELEDEISAQVEHALSGKQLSNLQVAMKRANHE